MCISLTSREMAAKFLCPIEISELRHCRRPLSVTLCCIQYLIQKNARLQPVGIKIQLNCSAMKLFIWIYIQIGPQFYFNLNNKLAPLENNSFLMILFLLMWNFRSVWLPQQASSMCQITTLMELWCAQSDRCLQHVQSHGLTFQREIASPNTRCGPEIDGLISKRLAGQVWSVCSWTAFPSERHQESFWAHGAEKWL